MLVSLRGTSLLKREGLKSLRNGFLNTEKIDSIINNMRDPMPLFRSKDIYHWQLNGSYSLKNVLPVLVPEMSYADLEVSNGGMAANAYIEMIQTEDAKEREQIRQSLLKYCELDTLAIVRILESLKEMVFS